MADKDLAKEAVREGKNVELNDDNQIVDRRELLSAGLNLSAPNTRKLGLSIRRKEPVDPEAVNTHTAVGTAATRREINARRAREVQEQLSEESRRVAEARRLEEEKEREKTSMKRTTDDAAQSARERYLERKRRKLETAAETE